MTAFFKKKMLNFIDCFMLLHVCILGYCWWFDRFLCARLVDPCLYVPREPDVPKNATLSYKIELQSFEDEPVFSKLTLNDRIQRRFVRFERILVYLCGKDTVVSSVLCRCDSDVTAEDTFVLIVSC